MQNDSSDTPHSAFKEKTTVTESDRSTRLRDVVDFAFAILVALSLWPMLMTLSTRLVGPIVDVALKLDGWEIKIGEKPLLGRDGEHTLEPIVIEIGMIVQGVVEAALVLALLVLAYILFSRSLNSKRQNQSSVSG